MPGVFYKAQRDLAHVCKEPFCSLGLRVNVFTSEDAVMTLYYFRCFACPGISTELMI